MVYAIGPPFSAPITNEKAARRLDRSQTGERLTINVSSAFSGHALARRMRTLNRGPEGMLEWVHSREHIGRARRVKIRMAVSLELSEDRIVKALLDDLSKDGFRLRSGALLHPGQRLRMHLPRETVSCELKWVDGLEAGGVFSDAPTVPAW